MKTRFKVLLPLLWLSVLPAVVQAQFTFTTNKGAITITGYPGCAGAVSLPSAANGLPVTSIGGYAFQSRTTLTNVTIPDSYTNIGDGAFSYCTRLTSITLSNGIVSIGNHAFYYCTAPDIPASR
jgi:hypothetical protein